MCMCENLIWLIAGSCLVARMSRRMSFLQESMKETLGRVLLNGLEKRKNSDGSTSNTRICSEHFSCNLFENKMKFDMGHGKILGLHKHAVPTIYPIILPHTN